MVEPVITYAVIAGIFGGGAAWGGAKAALNGTRQRVKDLQVDLKEHIHDDSKVQTDTIDRLARIETKLDALIKEL